MQDFKTLFDERLNLLKSESQMESDYRKEMQRFLPKKEIDTNFNQSHYWTSRVHLIKGLKDEIF